MKTTCVLLLTVGLLSLSCKKANTDKMVFDDHIISISDYPVDIDMDKTILMPSGKDGFQYAYADILELRDNKLMVVFCRKKNMSDFSAGSEIVAIHSGDGGKTWTSPTLIQENIALINTSAPSLIKVSENHLMLFFSTLQSEAKMDLMYKESFDTGNTWSSPLLYSQPNSGYYICNNGRVRMINGRIIAPVAHVFDNIFDNYDKQRVFTYFSDDLGKTWNISDELKGNFALMEPGVVSVDSDRYLMNIRTRRGKVLFARSNNNNGISWKLSQSEINSPASPQTIIHLNNSDTLIMVWNNTTKDPSKSHRNRTPLAIAVSNDQGYTWKYLGNIENASNYDFSYPAMISNDKYIYCVYYERDHGTLKNYSLKMAKIKRASLKG